MSFEPVFDGIKTEEKLALKRAQAVVEARLVPPDGVTVTKVLSVSCESSVGAAEVFTGEARYNGKVDFSVLYAGSDGEIRIMEARAEFTDKISDDRINGKINPFFVSGVLDVDASKSTETEICPACVVEITLIADEEKETRCLTACSDEVYTKEEKVEYLKLVASGKKNVAVSASCENTGIEKLLKSSVCAIIRKTTALTDAVLVEGEIIVRLIGTGANGYLCEKICKNDFAEEFEAPDVRSGDFAAAFVTSPSHSVRGISEDGSITYETEVSLDFGWSVFTNAVSGIISDTFCMRKETVMTRESEDICRKIDCLTFSETVTGNVTLDIGNPPVDNILCFDAVRANVTGCYAQEGRITVEGIVSGCVIYYSEEADADCSVNVEIPFSVTENADIAAGASPFVTAVVCDSSVRARRANEISVKTEVFFSIISGKKKKCWFITGLSEGEELKVKPAAVTVHLAAKGEGLWDVAKNTGFAPEEIMAQNPELNLPLHGGERILVYRNIDAKD